MSDGGMIPAEAQGLAIVVLLYTLANALVAGLVVLMHMRHGDPFGCRTPQSTVADVHTYTDVLVYRCPTMCMLHDRQYCCRLRPADTLLHQIRDHPDR